MPNVKPLLPTETSRTFEFTLEVGQESIDLPQGFLHPKQVWLWDLRRRKVQLNRIREEEYIDFGRTYRFGNDQPPVHLRGMPVYYYIKDGDMFVLPVPAHAWTGAVSNEQISEQQKAGFWR